MSHGPSKTPQGSSADDAIELADEGLIEIVDEESISEVGAPQDLPGLAPAPLELLDFSMPAPASAQGTLELSDLPAPSDIQVDLPPMDLADLAPMDLGPMDLPAMEDLPTAVELDMPAPDLELASAPTLQRNDALPEPPSLMAPNLMDDMAPMSLADLPTPSAAGASRDAGGMVDLAETDAGASLEIAGAGPQAAHAKLGGYASVGGAQEAMRVAPVVEAKRKTPYIVAATLVVLAAASAGVYFSPLGVVLDLPGRRPPPPPPPPVVAKSDAKTAAPVVLAPTPSLPPPPLVALSKTSVNSINYASIVAGMAKLSDSDKGERGLKWWAAFRLAQSYDDTGEQTTLNDALATKWEPGFGALGLAAQAGAAIRQNKLPLAKKTLARAKGPLAKAPEIQFVTALMATRKRPVPPKVLASLEHLAQGGLEDAQILHAEIMLDRKGKEHDAAVQDLVQLAQHSNPDTVARAATLLWGAESWEGLRGLLSGTPNTASWVQTAPHHRDILWRLLLRQQVREADMGAALTAANERFKNTPNSAEALIELLRMTAYTNGNVVSVRGAGFKTLTNNESQARVMYDAVTMALRRKDDAAVQSAYKGLMSVPEADAMGWIKLAEGDVARAAGNHDQAKKSYEAAAAWRGGFDEAKVALTLLDTSPDRINGLREALSARHDASSPLLAAVVQAESASGAYMPAQQAQEALLWLDPTYQDPMESLLRAVDLTDRSGEALRAVTWAEKLATAHPEDDRPVALLIELSTRGKRFDDMVKWYNVLLQRHPNQRATTVALANAYIDANKQNQALRVLEELAKADPEARDADFLYTEGRAYGAQDMVKARGFFNASLKAKQQVKTYILMGDLEQNRGKSDEALDAYRNALNLDPNLTAVQLKAAHILIGKGFTKEAVANLQSIVVREPHNPEAAEMLGDALREQGDAKAAVEAYGHAVGPHPETQVSLLIKMSRLQLQELGDVPAAAKTLRELVKGDPRNAEAQYYLGFALRDMGKIGEARTAMQAYLRLAPDGEFSREVRQTLEDLGKR